METILCPECGAENPLDAIVCGHCNANLNAVKSILDNASDYYNQALSRAHQGQLDEALGQLDAALALTSENAAYHNLAGTIYAQKGLYSEAIRAWERALRLDPEMEKAFQNIERARRMEEDVADEQANRPLKMTAIIACVCAVIFLLTTVLLSAHSFLKSRSINSLKIQLSDTQTIANDRQVQVQSINDILGTNDITSLLKTVTQEQTKVVERDNRISSLERQIQRNTDRHSSQITLLTTQLKETNEENIQLQAQLAQIDLLKEVIIENETQVDQLQQSLDGKIKDLKQANVIAQKHKTNLLIAQQTILSVKSDRDKTINSIQRGAERQVNDFRDQLLELRDEIARYERKKSDQNYANDRVADAVRNMDNAQYPLAMRDVETALERISDHSVALFIKDQIETTLNNPLELELRILEVKNRATLREEKRVQLVSEHLRKANLSLTAGLFNQAIDHARRALALNSSEPKDVQSGKRLLAQSIEIQQEVSLLLLEVQTSIEENRQKDAKNLLKQVLKKAPSNPQALELQNQIN